MAHRLAPGHEITLQAGAAAAAVTGAAAAVAIDAAAVNATAAAAAAATADAIAAAIAAAVLAADNCRVGVQAGRREASARKRQFACTGNSARADSMVPCDRQRRLVT